MKNILKQIFLYSEHIYSDQNLDRTPLLTLMCKAPSWPWKLISDSHLKTLGKTITCHQLIIVVRPSHIERK